MIELSALIFTVLASSLVGSVHCAGMCGVFSAMAVGGESNVASSTRHAAYNAGRLVVYSIIGLIGGMAGASIDLGGSMVGLSRIAAVIAGITMVAIGLIAIARTLGVRIRGARLPGFVQRLATAGNRFAMSLSPVWRAATIGVMTAFLPCGWLYAFAILAMGTGHPLHGMLVMIVFWMGTLPVLIAIGAGVRRLLDRAVPRVSLLTSIAIVIVGLFTTFDRLTLPAFAGKHEPSDESQTSLVEQAAKLDSSKSICCEPQDD